ncbi:potassium channel family protein [Desulfosoma caldarium]|uniref:Ion channel n=1 Tax=Desulfosoma caldarium TaxID=610254 RepID=A0A3N1VL22_9BACT|nr:potassium channel family protein [Desulfosoma caldarium]ROR01698.1 ion channel [Desulfosoma caldarium]
MRPLGKAFHAPRTCHHESWSSGDPGFIPGRRRLRPPWLYYSCGSTFVKALYMTAITRSTVGNTEFRPLDTRGRLFTAVLIEGGVSLAAYHIASGVG